MFLALHNRLQTLTQTDTSNHTEDECQVRLTRISIYVYIKKLFGTFLKCSSAYL